MTTRTSSSKCHIGASPYKTGAIDATKIGQAVGFSVAVGDLDGAGKPCRDIVIDSLDGFLYALDCKGQLRSGFRATCPETGGILGAPLHQPPIEDVTARRKQKDEDRIATDALPDLGRSLHVDLDHHILAAGNGGADLLHRSPVEVTVHRGPLQKFTALDHLFEPTLVDEPVRDTVALGGPLWPRGERHAVME